MHPTTKATVESVAKHLNISEEASINMLIEAGYRCFEAEQERKFLPAPLLAKLDAMRANSGKVLIAARVSSDLAAQVKATATAAKTTSSKVISALVADGLKDQPKSFLGELAARAKNMQAA